MGKIIFKGNWAKCWGITSMDVEPDCEIVNDVGYVYIHRYGDTIPCCALKKKWIREAFYEKDGKVIKVLPAYKAQSEENCDETTA